MKETTGMKNVLFATTVVIVTLLIVVGWLGLHDEMAVSAFQLNEVSAEQLQQPQPPFLLLAAVSTCTTICHTADEHPVTLCVDPGEVAEHLAHGDSLGECEAPVTPKPTATEVPTGEFKVDVIAPEPQVAQLGTTLEYEFEVVNKGSYDDKYSLTLSSEPELELGDIPERIAVKEGHSKIVPVTIELPLEVDFDSFKLTLHAMSRDDHNEWDEDSVTTWLVTPVVSPTPTQTPSEPVVEFEKTVDTQVLVPGQQVTYTLSYRNVGEVPLLDAKITEFLPSQLQFEYSSIPAVRVDESTLLFKLPPEILPAQAGDRDEEIFVTARVNDDVDSYASILNRAEFSAEALPEPLEAEARSSIEIPELTITKEGNRSDVEVGDLILYRIVVSNSGSGVAKDVRILDTFPTALTYAPGTSTLNGAAIDDPRRQGHQRVWQIGDLPGGDEIVLRYRASIPAGTKPGRYKNAAIVKATDTAGGDLRAGPVKSELRVKGRGLKALADLETFVFWDKNGDGFADPDEPGLPDIEVKLVRELQDVRTDDDGEVFFADVKPGEQLVALDERKLPKGFSLTTDASVLVTLGERDLGYAEFGVQTGWAELIGKVYYDVNGNGRYESDEPGLEDIALLIDEKTAFTTDRNGSIVLTDLEPGPHSVMLDESTLPEQFKLTSDAFFLHHMKAQSASTIYFSAELRPGTVDAHVFYDTNENGMFDEGEPGVSNAEIVLQNGKRYQARTDRDGTVLFAQIPPNAYTIRLIPESLVPGSIPLNGLVRSFHLEAAGEENVVWPVAPPEQAEQAVIETPTPSPTSTPTVEESPTPTPTETPLEEEFCSYSVEAGDTLTKIAEKFTGAGSNYVNIAAFNKIDADALRVGDELKLPKSLLLEQYRTCQFEENHIVEGHIYYDRNADGHYDEGFDIPIPGVSVNIRSDVKTTVTDENGYYRFENMEPGGHIVWIDPQTLPEPYRPLDDQPIIQIVVYPGQTTSTTVVDFVVLQSQIYEDGVVEGVVCLDLNGNNDCDSGEPGIVGVTVYDPPVVTVAVDQIDPAGNNTPLNICEPVTFRVTITNTGDEDAVNLDISNVVPAGFDPPSSSLTGQTVPFRDLPAETGIRTFDFTYNAGCDAVSGDHETTVTFEGPAGTSHPAIQMNRSLAVNPGAITLTKVATAVNGASIPETSEPDAEIGDVITWRIRVRSSSLGSVKNVEVTDTLGTGLVFTDSTPSPRTFNSSTNPELANIAANDEVDILVNTTVSACSDLTTDTSATWGCGTTADCLDPDVTAQAGVDLQVGHPLLDYNPPDVNINVPYCAAAPVVETVSIPITNNGDGIAYNVSLEADNFGTLNVNVTAPSGASYNSGTNTFENIGDIPVGGTVTLVVELSMSLPDDWCTAGATLESGSIVWEPSYYDDCNAEFHPPLRNSTYSVTMDQNQPKPMVDVQKTCSFGSILTLGTSPQTVTCDVSVTYTGPTSCGSGPGNVSPLAVSDDYPEQWTLNSTVPNAGTPALDSYNDNGTSVSWIIPAAEIDDGDTFSYVQTFTVPGIDNAAGCSSCGNQWENTFSVNGTDCCGNCPISDSETVETYVECPDPTGIGLASNRTVLPSPGEAEVCKEALTFSNRYEFSGSRWDNIPWANNVVFTEENANDLELVGDVEVSLDDGATYCTLPPTAYTNNTPTGGDLIVTDFSACGAAGNIGDGTVLIIRYDLRPTDASTPSCGDGGSEPFVDYGTLEVLDTSGGGTLPPGEYCQGSGAGSVIVRDADEITIQRSQMSVDIVWSQPTPLVSPCGEYDATITVTKDSEAPAYDVVLFLSSDNYETVSVQGCSGVTPANDPECDGSVTGPDISTVGGYVWNYADLFDGPAGQTATLNIHVQGRCLSDPDLSVELGYNDGCHDGTPPDLDPASRSCPVQQDAVSGIIRDPLLTVTKFPEVIYAKGILGQPDYEPAEWSINVFNSGAGSAYGVQVLETLGGDLSYPAGGGAAPALSSEWDDTTGLSRTVNSSQEVLYEIEELTPGESRRLTFRADINGCENAENDVIFRVSCLSDTCAEVVDSSYIKYPPTNLDVTVTFGEPGDTCSEKFVTLTAKNSGMTPVSDLTLFQIFPDSLNYVSGSSEYRLNPPNPDNPASPAWTAIGDPLGAGTEIDPYHWDYNNTSLPDDLEGALVFLPPGDIIQIRFNGYVGCDFNGGQLRFYGEYDECGAAGRLVTKDAFSSPITPNKPILRVEKTAPNTDITCNQQVEWTLSVTNEANGTAGQPVAAQYVELRDTLGSGFDAANAVILDSGGTPVTSVIHNGQDLYWSLQSLQPGTTETYTIRAEFDDCSGTLENTFSGKAGCDDGSGGASCFICRYDDDPAGLPDCPKAEITMSNQTPNLGITLNTPVLRACTENVPIQITLENTSTEAALFDLDLDIELPAGVSYVANSATVDGSPVSDSDLTFSGQHIIFYDNDYANNNLPDISAGGSVVLGFQVDIQCSAGGNFSATPQFHDCCGVDPGQGSISINTNWEIPELRVEVTNDSGPFECGEDIDWTFHVYNDGGLAAEMVRLVNLVGSGMNFVNGGAAPNGDDFYEDSAGDQIFSWNASRELTWELANLPANPGPGQCTGGICHREFHLWTRVDAGNCNDPAERRNTLNATWHCADPLLPPPEEDPNTDESICTSAAVSDAHEANVTPLADASASVTPIVVPQCAVNTTVFVDITVPDTSSTIYNMETTITLPTGMAFHNTGALSNLQVSVQSGNASGLASPVVANFPTNGANTITFSSSSSLGLLASSVDADPTVIRVQFDVSSSCFSSGDINVTLNFEDCCGNSHTVGPTPSALTSGEPDLDVSVNRVVPPNNVDCGETIEYEITVTNNGDSIATYAVVEAALGEWLTFDSATTPAFSNVVSADYPVPPFTRDTSGPSCYTGSFPTGCAACSQGDAGTVRWELTNLVPTETWTTTLTVEFDRPAAGDCDDVDRQITVSTFSDCPSDTTSWTFDDNACTNDGSGTCIDPGSSTYTDENESPDLVATIGTPTISCVNGLVSGEVDVTIANQGDGATFASDFVVQVDETTGTGWAGTATYTGTLAPGASATMTVDLFNAGSTPDCDSCSPTVPNGYSFTANVDSDTDVCECDESNNTSSPVSYDPCASIGNLVWFDVNGDGVQDGGLEAGVAGVTVNLLDQDGNTLATTTTDANGEYLFDGLFPGEYAIEFDLTTLPTGYIVTTQDASGGTDDTDSDADRSTGQTINTTLDPGENDLSWDMGIYHPVSIGNYVWLDADAEGDQDEVGTGIPGVSVQLLDAATMLPVTLDAEGNSMSSTTTTDANGLYNFTNLPPGDYVVSIPASNWTSGVFSAGQYEDALGSPGAGADDQNNADDNGNNDGTAAFAGVQSSSIELLSGQEPTDDGDSDNNSDLTIDFGFYQGISLGNYVWYDANGDGTQDPGESGIAGATVRLFLADGTTPATDISGAAVADQTTGADGLYQFVNLPPGDYVVEVIPPAAYYSLTTGGADPDDNDNTDSNGYLSGTRFLSLPVTLTSQGEPITDGDTDSNSNLTVDFGFVRYDYGDLPDNITNYPDYPTLNASTGAYHLIDDMTYLGAGVDAEGDGQPNETALGDDNTGPLADDEDGVVFVTPLMAGRPYEIQVNAGPNAGVLNAWIDWNGNGALEAGERLGAADQAIAGGGSVTLTGTAPATAPTSLYSRFRFTAAAGQGGGSPTGLAASGEVEDYVLMSLGNRVWRDNGDSGGTGNNGIQDGGESGIPGVVMELLDGSGNPVTDSDGNPLTVTTDGNGDYLFTGLLPGDYRVRVAASNFQSGNALEGLLSSWDRPGFGDAQVQNNQDVDENGIDNPNPASNGITSGVTTLVRGGESTTDGDTDANSDRTIDFGFIEYDYGDLPDTPYPTSLASNGARHALDGRTYLGGGVDADSDGQPHVSAGSVILAAGDDGDGNDDEDGVVFVTPLMPGRPYEIEVNAGPNAGVLNAWIDWNGNGTLEAGERLGAADQGISGGGSVTLTGTAPATAQTSLYSRFRFTALAGQGGDSPTGAAATGEVEDYVLMSLGNRVWRDNGDGGGTGNNGIQDGGERGIENVLVELLDSAGNPVLDEAGNPITTTTDSVGDYLFSGLPEGQYQVRIAASNFQSGGVLEGMLSSSGSGDPEIANDQDVDENGIDDPNPFTNGILSGVTTLTPGTESTADGDTDPNSDRTIDFGFVEHDWGDLPDTSYPTLLTANGARHVLDGRTYLGAGVDTEGDGQPNEIALGDDNAGPSADDEDGVVFDTPLMPNQPYQITVTGTPGSILNAWIDFDNDGTLETQIATNLTIPASGILTLNGTAPATVGSSVYSRFRLTAAIGQGGDSPTGAAQTGEVEDYVLGSLGSRLWRDNGEGTPGGSGNNNGRQDGTETGLENAIVALLDRNRNPILDSNGNPVTTTTDANGDYSFTGLPEGDYVIHVMPENFESGGALENLYSSSDPHGSPNDPRNGRPGYGIDQGTDENGIDEDYPHTNGIFSMPVDLEFGQEPTGEDGDANSDMTIDFGFIRIDFGDVPASYPTTMDHNAARHVIDDFNFLGLSVDAESDGKPSNTALGDDSVLEPDDEDGVVFLTPVMPGEEFQIAVRGTSLSGTPGYLTAWIDFNGDGDFDDPGEYIIDTLPDPVNDPIFNNEMKILTFTAPNFSQTAASTLYSRFRYTTQAGGITTPDGEAPDGEVEDYALLSLGDFVWIDEGQGGGLAGDGKQNGSEPAVPNVKMELYLQGQTPGSDTPIAATTTNDEGRYYFTGLQPGNYIVHIPSSEFQDGGPLEDMVSSLGAGVPNDDLDEEGDENGRDEPDPAETGISSGVVSLTFGNEPTGEDGDPNSNLTIDFGFHELVSLGNRVWFDPDNNGLHEDDEEGIAGVEVHLYRLDGTLALNYDWVPCITTTDEYGYYLFDRLVPGYYLVRLPDSNFDAGAALEGLTNSYPTLFDPNQNCDRADHGIMPGDGELDQHLACFGQLSDEDLIPQGELLPGFEGAGFFEEFIFDETVPEIPELPAVEEGVETITPPTLP